MLVFASARLGASLMPDESILLSIRESDFYRVFHNCLLFLLFCFCRMLCPDARACGGLSCAIIFVTLVAELLGSVRAS